MYCEVIELKELDEEGTRVCLDFTDLINENEGIYVGNTGNGYLYILPETRVTKKYPPRPFRINCGAIHQYLYTDEKTFYLSDIVSGTKIDVFGINSKRSVIIGRAKLEKRRLIIIRCKKDDIEISATLQYAESVYLSGETDDICIQDLKVGDKIKCKIDTAGRHMGEKIDEFIIEK